MYSNGQFILMYGKNHHNIVIILQLKQINKFLKNEPLVLSRERRGQMIGVSFSSEQHISDPGGWELPLSLACSQSNLANISF